MSRKFNLITFGFRLGPPAGYPPTFDPDIEGLAAPIELFVCWGVLAVFQANSFKMSLSLLVIFLF